MKFKRLLETGNNDCMFFGSSMVDVGLDAKLFEEILLQRAGKKYSCLNMGFSGAVFEVSGKIATTVNQWNRLDLVILGVSPIDMDPAFQRTRPIADMPVFTYYNGQPSLTGWLYNHFNLPWFYGSFSHLKNSIYQAHMLEYDHLVDDHGMQRMPEIGAIGPPTQQVLFPDYRISEEDLEIFHATIETFQKQGTQVIVVEMPVHPDYFPNLVDNGADGYENTFIKPIKNYLDAKGILFVQTQNALPDIDNDLDWFNWYHLNTRGAEKFTRYLAQKILDEGL